MGFCFTHEAVNYLVQVYFRKRHVQFVDSVINYEKIINVAI